MLSSKFAYLSETNKVTVTQVKIQNFIGGCIAGCIGGAISGLFGTSFWDALMLGGFWGGAISVMWGLAPRDSSMPRIAVESFGMAGLVGAIAGSVGYDSGYLGVFISCAFGYVAGLLLPALLLALFGDS